MQQHQFVFDLNFDIPEATLQQELIEMPPPLLYTQEDLDAALKQGETQGHSLGLEEGILQGELQAFTEQRIQIQTAFSKIYETLDSIFKKEEEKSKEFHQNTTKLITIIIEKVFPNYWHQHGATELAQAISMILDTIVEPQPVFIYVAPLTFNDCQDNILEMQTKYKDSVQIKTDESLKEWECRIEWKGGGAKWSHENIMQAIQTTLQKTSESNQNNNQLIEDDSQIEGI